MSSGKAVHVRGALEYDVYVGRRMPHYKLYSAWGNPFKVEKHGLEKSLKLYEQLIRSWLSYEAPDRQDRRAALLALRGKTLACWCAPKDRALTPEDPIICHAQVLQKLAEELEKADV